MRTLLICHEGADLDQIGLGRWLASFSNLTGIIVLQESRRMLLRRLRREVKRVGLLRILDVLAFRLYYKAFIAKHDKTWQEYKLQKLCSDYPDIGIVPLLFTESPNSRESEEFIRKLVPDIIIARCKILLREKIFSIASVGTFVMHPGICPEYRNSHGCFWALANGDKSRVGMTLLKIDKGVDTGPVYGYYTYPYDEKAESHIVIQHRVVLDNLEALKDKLTEIHAGRALPLDTSGRRSAMWGQPWMTSYLRWKLKRKSKELQKWP